MAALCSLPVVRGGFPLHNGKPSIILRAMSRAAMLPGFAEACGGDITVEGTVVRVRLARGDFRVLDVEVDRGGRLLVETWIGEMQPVAVAQRVRGTGKRETHREHGEQFRVSVLIPIVPTTRAAIIEYLGGGVIDGIGPALAVKIVEHFGDKVLDVLDLTPERVLEVPGIGPDRGEKIAKGWRIAQATSRMMIFMQAHGAPPQLAARIVRFYLAKNEDPLHVVQNDPYRLALDIPRVGFLTADAIACSIGIGVDSDARAQAASLHTIGEIGKDGHTFIDLDELVGRVSTLTKRHDARAHIRAAIEALHPRVLVLEWRAGEPEPTLFGPQVDRKASVFLPDVHAAEWGIARRVMAIMAGLGRARADSSATMTGHAETSIEAFCKRTGFELAPEQHAAVLAAATSPFLVITGGPGTGKTASVSIILDTFRRASMRVVLCAPTGRAAKRLSELSGAPASTIHRLLEMKPGSAPAYDEEKPLDCDVLLIDEASMVDLRLASVLLAAVPPGARVICIGDRDQLPSVQPGAVLRDIIASSAVPVVALQHVFRQGPGSTIAKAAALINRGIAPKGDESQGGEFFVISRGNQDVAADTIEHLVRDRIPDRFGIKSAEIAVLVPQHKGSAGTVELNRRLQDALNPKGAEILRSGRRFRVGDRVMQMKNDYNRGVFNGELGVVISVDRGSAEMVVDFDGSRLTLDDDGMDSLALAYASTVHRAQGGQYPAVVVYMGRESEHMISRPLFYTAVTRAQRLCVVIATDQTIASAIRESWKDKRRTRLAERLKAWVA